MRLKYSRFDLALAHRWAIATDGVSQPLGKTVYPVVFVELEDRRGRRGIGEASPSSQYHESHETVARFLAQVDPRLISFDQLDRSMAYVNGLASGNYPAKCAVNLALLDGIARSQGRPLSTELGLGYTEDKHWSSFTIGLDTPEVIERKVREAEQYSILKIKVGGPQDRENLAAVRKAAPHKVLRVDANAGWKTRESALAEIEWLATDGKIEFVEQPMPAETPLSDLKWLFERSPLPLIADESYQSSADVDVCAQAFHGVNVKLVKTGGVTAAKLALEAARQRGLKTMIGCMIESSVLISAGAHLAELADYLDLDGNVLITNDPFQGVTNQGGKLGFASAKEKVGLRVMRR